MKKLFEAAERLLFTEFQNDTLNRDARIALTDAVLEYRLKRRGTPRQRLYTVLHQAIEDEGIVLPSEECKLHRLMDRLVQEVERRLGL